MIVPASRHTRSGGQATNAGKDGLAERIPWVGDRQYRHLNGPAQIPGMVRTVRVPVSILFRVPVSIPRPVSIQYPENCPRPGLFRVRFQSRESRVPVSFPLIGWATKSIHRNSINYR